MEIVKVRKANQSDAEAIWEIFYEVVQEGTSFLSDERVRKEDAISFWLSSQAATFVACLNDQVVGTYSVKPNYHGRGSHVANATYMVKSSWRGQGIGKKLGAHSLKTAKEMGFTALQFNMVVSTNLASVRLWQSLGFSIIGTVPQGFQHSALGLVDVYIMHRFL